MRFDDGMNSDISTNRSRPRRLDSGSFKSLGDNSDKGKTSPQATLVAILFVAN